MRIGVISSKSAFQQIRISLESIYGTAKVDIDFTNYAANNLCKIENLNVLVSDIDCIETVQEEILDRIELSEIKFLIYVSGIFIDPYDMKQVNILEKDAIQKERWNVVRKINETKLKINYLFKRFCLDSYPNYVQFEMTDYCNAECIMCSHLYQKNIGATHLTKESFNYVREILPYVRVAVLHGNGEPFLNPNIYDYLEEYCRYNISVTTSTNLSVFNDRIAYYINHCFSDIRVSCDGCTAEIYEGIRRNLSFERFKNNLLELKEKCSSVRKIMACVIMKQNIFQLCDMTEFAKEYDLDEIIFSNMTPSVALGNDEDSPIHFLAEAGYQLMKAKKRAGELGISIVYPDVYNKIDNISEKNVVSEFRTDEQIEERIKYIRNQYGMDRAVIELLSDCRWDLDRLHCVGICDWCIEKTYIDLNGNVFICCINSKYSIGNINEKSFKEIWNSEEMIKVRKSFYSGILPDFCEGCHFILNHTLTHIKDIDTSSRFNNKRCISRLYTESENNG